MKEIRSLHTFLADFFRKHSTIKDFSSRRVPYHYEQASMFTELVAYLRSQDSRRVGRNDRQAYLRVRIFMNQEENSIVEILETSLHKSDSST